MSEQTHTDEHDDHHEHFIVPWKYYVVNAVIIAALMFLTIFAATFDFGHTNGLNLVFAILIAAAKTFFIGAIFMGVWWNTPLVKVFATCAIVWLGIMFSFMMIDYASPKWGLGTPYRDFAQPGAAALPGGSDAQAITDMEALGHADDKGDHGDDDHTEEEAAH